MDWATMSEEAYKNGKAAGFAEGLAAAGIAPIQWRSVRDIPLPERGDVILWTNDGDYKSGRLSRSGRDGYLHLVTSRFGAAEWVPIESVSYWCPIEAPAEAES